MKNTEALQERVEIANRLKQIRAAKGFTQEQVAEKLGMAHVTYIKLENASHNLTTRNVRKICKVFGVSSDLLLFGDTGAPNINFGAYIKLAQMFTPDEITAARDNFELMHQLQQASQNAEIEKELVGAK